MKLGDRVEYRTARQTYTATIIGELEREFIIRTDQVIREGYQIEWTYHVRIAKHQVSDYLAPLQDLGSPRLDVS